MTMISHEIPLALIDKHQDAVSDYMFALLHKLEEDPEYARKVYEYSDAGGVVYLDNSCYELGEAMSDELLHKWHEEIHSDVVILPDVLGHDVETYIRIMGYLKKFPDDIVDSMAVAQGATRGELIACYRMLVAYRDADGRGFMMIGIPFVFPWIPKEPEAQATARIDLLTRMVKLGLIDETRPHHLLGTWQAREFIHYRNYNWVASIDTSNPVMAAIDGTPYGPFGLDAKPKATFDSSYHLTESEINMDLLYSNVKSFKEIVHGNI